ncbi:NADH-quinone oxidoreductase subunit NuoN [Sulfuriflexus mobilis]|uniref:NADH-quinone oxidoreductase subunit NuoN n=1 Tax=Sulfuriflexus mobilis TaxID=1811807 RepID=UPI000F819AB2|nr:NADH-quinone oxidoreductase subunit NuoN [Sulfuriflexus mobilis]
MTTTFTMPDFALAAPEIYMLSMACVVLVADLFISDKNRVVTYMLTQLTLLGAVLLTIMGAPAETRFTFGGMYVSDDLSTVLKTVIYIVTGFVFLYSRDYLRDRDIFKGEYYVLGLFGVLGMMVMVSAHSFLTVYLGLELLSLSLYAMVAFRRDSLSASEAAMKYFILGALASGMLLYGISMIYGATGTLDISKLSAGIAARGTDDIVLIFGLVFIVVGLAFKLGAVPFHMWIPDVYQGAPTSVTMYIGSAPKIAGFALVMRVLAEGLGDLHGGWQDMLVILAVLSLAVGNIIALAQTNLKRMLAYSTISHVGFLLLGILSGTKAGYSASLFYIITYAATAAGGFAMVILLSRRGFEAENLDDLKGLNERSPWLALMMLLLMFSMAGVPPTVGFYAKLIVLKSVIDIQMAWLAIVAVLFSVIGAFYYLRVVKLMYFDAPAENAEVIHMRADTNIAFSVNALAVLYLGILPGGLLALCTATLS